MEPFLLTCHCGGLGFTLHTPRAPESWPLHACSCSFCSRHSARTFRDPGSEVRWLLRRPDLLSRYRFGQKIADYLCCHRCGVYLGAMFEVQGQAWATLNVNALDEPPSQPARAVHYDGELASQRIARRKQQWTPVVRQLVGSAASGAMLEAMEAFDLRVRAELVRTGQLFEGYDPRMQRVHLANARRLERMLEDGPWPTREIVGEDGARAAWLIVQHALPAPSLMRRALPFIREAAKVDEASAVRAAMLEDRIATLEGRPQRWGTQFDWDETGRLVPQPLEDPAGVDARRLEIGLPPLAEQTERHQAAAAAEGQQPPSDPVSRRAAMETWLRKVGWRT